MTYRQLDTVYGRDARDRSAEMTEPGFAGAEAALETFYRAFNTADLELFRRVWIPDERIRLKNPLGGVVDGITAISELYATIFHGPADVWVEFRDVLAYDLGDAFVFSGQEHGAFTRAGHSVDLHIRTTRILHRVDGRWGQIHHHGSITDPTALDAYQRAVRR